MMMRLKLRPRGRLLQPPPSSRSHLMTSPAPAPTPTPTQTMAHHSLIRQLCSSGLSLPPLPNDLLHAPDPCKVRIEPFRVNIGEVKRFEAAIDREKGIARKKMEESVRRSNFEKFYKPALQRRGLYWSQSLLSEESRMMHLEYKNIMGRPPKYLTADRFMVHAEEMPKPYCRLFLDSLSNERTIVLDDWTTIKIVTSLGISMHDFGVIIPNQQVHVKGESDASYRNGKATIGAILWPGNQILCEIYCDVPCKSSTMAEARGVFLQLEMGIPLQFLQPCTDNYPVYRVLKGELLHLDDDQEGMCELLRHMRVYFKGLVPRWIPREELKPIDGLLRDPRLKAGPLSDASNRFVVKGLIHRCASQINGQPIFTIQGKQPSVRKPANKTSKLKANCYLEVEEEDKASVMFHIIHAFRPSLVSIVCKDKRYHLEKEIADHFGDDCVFKRDVSDGCIRLSLAPPVEPHKKSRHLLIVLDVSIPKENYTVGDSYTVYLPTAEEKEKLKELKINAYGPMALWHFIKMFDRPLRS